MTKMKLRSRAIGEIGKVTTRPSSAATLLFAGVAVALLISSPSHADEDHEHDHERARQLRAQGKIVSLESIMDQAMQIKPGRILETELKNGDDNYRYEVEILGDDGKVWELIFDGASGKLLETQQERK